MTATADELHQAWLRADAALRTYERALENIVDHSLEEYAVSIAQVALDLVNGEDDA